MHEIEKNLKLIPSREVLERLSCVCKGAKVKKISNFSTE